MPMLIGNKNNISFRYKIFNKKENIKNSKIISIYLYQDYLK